MTDPNSQIPEGEDPVEALVFETLERMESEGSAAIESAVSDFPELEDELRSRLGALQAMGLVETPLDIPDQIGGFELGKLLGEGGMGLVYEAFDPVIKRSVAIKLIRPQYLSRRSLRERFVREGQAVARLQHPSVARVYQVGEEQGLPYIAMERVFGCTVSAVLKQFDRKPAAGQRSGRDFWRAVCRLSGHEDSSATPNSGQDSELFQGSWADVVAKIVREVAEGLAHAHAAGVLHRDVKSSNVMVTPEGRVLLIDFGLAQLDTAATMTATGSRLGSLPYSAPERLESDSQPTPLGDVYSLGVVLYEMLTLRLPFRASSESALLHLIAKGKPQAIEAERGGAHFALADTVERAMRRDPMRRTPSAGALAEDLSRVLAGKGPVPYGDGPLAILRSRWKTQPWITTATLVATLLVVALPPAVLSVRARAAERVNDSGQASLRRLSLALEATQNLQHTLPDSPAIDGTPLGELRAHVMRDLAGIEARVEAERATGAFAGWTIQAAEAVPEPPDRVLIQEARRWAQRGLQERPESIAQAARLVADLQAVRAQTSRSLDVDAALIDLMYALAVQTRKLDANAPSAQRESWQQWKTQGLELCQTLQRTLPQSTWVATRTADLKAIGGGTTHE